MFLINAYYNLSHILFIKYIKERYAHKKVLWEQDYNILLQILSHRKERRRRQERSCEKVLNNRTHLNSYIQIEYKDYAEETVGKNKEFYSIIY